MPDSDSLPGVATHPGNASKLADLHSGPGYFSMDAMQTIGRSESASADVLRVPLALENSIPPRLWGVGLARNITLLGRVTANSIETRITRANLT